MTPMATFRKILVVPAGDAVEQPAVLRLRQLAGSATVAECFEPVHEPHLDGYLGNTEIYAPLREAVVREKSAKLDALATAIAARGPQCHAVARWDRPRDNAIAREALAFGAELVIVTPDRARHGILSSSDWKLVSHCPAPILVVKGDGEKRYENVVAAVDPVHAHAKPGDLDDAIVAMAAKVAAVAKAKLALVHCFLPLSYYDTDDIDRLPLKDAEDALEGSRRDALAALAQSAGLPESATELVAGKPEAIFESMAEEGRADLVVMGGLSRGMLADLLIGSTAERVLQHAACDVLIVKPPSLEIDVSIKT